MTTNLGADSTTLGRQANVESPAEGLSTANGLVRRVTERHGANLRPRRRAGHRSEHWSNTEVSPSTSHVGNAASAGRVLERNGVSSSPRRLTWSVSARGRRSAVSVVLPRRSPGPRRRRVAGETSRLKTVDSCAQTGNKKRRLTGDPPRAVGGKAPAVTRQWTRSREGSRE